MRNKVWFVTGASSGLGKTLAKKLLANEDFMVAATSRNVDRLKEAIGDVDNRRFLPLSVDLLSDQSVNSGIKKTVDTFGSLDVVVNNAGFELYGFLEELSIAEIRENFEVNLFAPIRIAKLIMPYFRSLQGGYIINVSSIGGTCYSWAGSSSYCASKAALDSVSKAMSDEVRRFGIYVTSVKPGQFRTNFFESCKLSEGVLNQYSNERVRHAEAVQDMNHNQPGSPEKLADLLIYLSTLEKPPVQIFAGKDAYEAAFQNASGILKNLHQWCEYSRNLDI